VRGGDLVRPHQTDLLRRRRSQGRRGRERRALFLFTHLPEVYGGIGETEAAALLRDFFVVRR